MVKEWYPNGREFQASSIKRHKSSALLLLKEGGESRDGEGRGSLAGGWFLLELEGGPWGLVFHEVIHRGAEYVAHGVPTGAPRGRVLPGGSRKAFRLCPLVHVRAAIARGGYYSPPQTFSRPNTTPAIVITANFLNWDHVKMKTMTKTRHKVERGHPRGKIFENCGQDYNGHSVQELEGGPNGGKELETNLVRATPKQDQPSASRSEGLPLWLARLESPNESRLDSKRKRPKPWVNYTPASRRYAAGRLPGRIE